MAIHDITTPPLRVCRRCANRDLFFFECPSILPKNIVVCGTLYALVGLPFVFSAQVYKRAVQGGLRDLGVVNRLSWAHVIVEDPGKRAPKL